MLENDLAYRQFQQQIEPSPPGCSLKWSHRDFAFRLDLWGNPSLARTKLYGQGYQTPWRSRHDWRQFATINRIV